MSDSEIVTRFAPSPTGFLHIGGARTALFNWLFARSRGGRFLLRIEDTDRVRSTAGAAEAIISGLQWLGLDWDGEPISQWSRRSRHRTAAESLLRSGNAYKCFSTAEEIAEAKALAIAERRSGLFRSPWRQAAASDHPDRPHSVRLKSPQSGSTVVRDTVHGSLEWQNAELDDMIILRSDGSPTYNFAVVVDDHEMAVSHIIRGDDHLTNTARQVNVYKAFGWKLPSFTHVPLILDENGRKLSKRSGDRSLESYQTEGYLPEAMRNYLVRLGWSFGDHEIFSTAQAVAWFSLEGLGKSAARLDRRKLEHLSGQHMAAADDTELLSELEKFRRRCGLVDFDPAGRSRISSALTVVKQRAKTLADLDRQLVFAIADRPIAIENKAKKALGETGLGHLRRLLPELEAGSWTRSELEDLINSACERENVGFGRIAQPLRSALTGRTASPGIVDTLLILGKPECVGRIKDVLGSSALASAT